MTILGAFLLFSESAFEAIVSHWELPGQETQHPAPCFFTINRSPGSHDPMHEPGSVVLLQTP